MRISLQFISCASLQYVAGDVSKAHSCAQTEPYIGHYLFSQAKYPEDAYDEGAETFQNFRTLRRENFQPSFTLLPPLSYHLSYRSAFMSNSKFNNNKILCTRPWHFSEKEPIYKRTRATQLDDGQRIKNSVAKQEKSERHKKRPIYSEMSRTKNGKICSLMDILKRQSRIVFVTNSAGERNSLEGNSFDIFPSTFLLL